MSKTKEAWRIESVFGYGPYPGYAGFERGDAANALADLLCDAHCDEQHPGPYKDGLICFPHYFYACPSPASLKAWFREFWDELRETGYSIVKYTVPDSDYQLGRSGKQCGVLKRNAITEVVPW